MRLDGVPTNFNHNHRVAVDGAVQVQINDATTDNIIDVVQSIALATSAVIVVNMIAKILVKRC